MAKIRQAIVGSIDWVLYTVLSENTRKKISNMFSTEKKEKLKSVLNYGAQRQMHMKLKQIKNHMYTYGFSDKGLETLKKMLEEEHKPNIHRMIAWEIAFWYANLYEKEAAKEALHYLEIAAENEKNQDQLRRISILQAESLLILDEREKSREVIQAQLEKDSHADLYLAMANTEEKETDKLFWLNKVYQKYGQSSIAFAVEKDPTYDDIVMAEHKAEVKDDEKVTIILPAYNAADGIQIAIESILQQTWRNLELIIVDDCSTDNTYEVIQAYAKRDDRIKVYQTEKNSGPYVARNIGLQHATGTYITINDSDDWSHEQKIEIQVKHLQENEHIIANTSEHARLLEETLQFYRRGTPGKFIFPNMSSIMFRKDIVMEKLGYWNCVRFAGDGEFKRRLVKTFGPQKYVDLQTGPLSLPRQSANSLTGSSAFGYNGFFMGARKEYVESLEYHHAQSESLYYPFEVENNIIAVPRPMWPEKQSLQAEVDILLVGDFRLVNEEAEKITAVFQHILQKYKKRKKIGLVQIYYYDLELSMDIHPTIRKHIANDDVTMFVYGEEIMADKTYVLSEKAFELKQTYIPSMKSNQVYVIANQTMTNNGLNYIQQSFQQLPVYIPYNLEMKNIVQEEDISPCTVMEENWVDIV